MRKIIIFLILFVAILAVGNISKSVAQDQGPEEVNNIRNMASCGPGCVCCLNNTYTYCGAAACYK